MRKYILMVFMLGLMLVLGGCKEKDKEFVMGDNELIHLTSTPRGGVETYQIYTTNIVIYVDGRVRIYASDFVRWFGRDEIPELTLYISQEAVKEIEQLIITNNVYNLREDVGNKDGISGVVKRMTVYAADGTNTTGGISVSNRQFVRTYDRVEAMVREDLYVYQGEINQIQYEGYISYSNRSVQLLDREGKTIMDHELINDVYTYEEVLEEDEQTAYYTVIEFNQDGAEILEDATFWATQEDVVVLTLHINGAFETNVTVKNVLNDGKLYIPQDTKEAADTLTEKIQSGLR